MDDHRVCSTDQVHCQMVLHLSYRFDGVTETNSNNSLFGRCQSLRSHTCALNVYVYANMYVYTNVYLYTNVYVYTLSHSSVEMEHRSAKDEFSWRTGT
jgi:hypothetical protein